MNTVERFVLGEGVSGEIVHSHIQFETMLTRSSLKIKIVVAAIVVVAVLLLLLLLFVHAGVSVKRFPRYSVPRTVA